MWLYRSCDFGSCDRKTCNPFIMGNQVLAETELNERKEVLDGEYRLFVLIFYSFLCPRVGSNKWVCASFINTFFVLNTGMTSLGSLNVSNSRVTNEGLRYLKPLKNLRTLSLESCKVTASEIKKLQSADLPNLISFRPRIDQENERILFSAWWTILCTYL